MSTIELMKVALFGIVEGITEWLPISSTGHMILLNEFLNLQVSPKFMDLFLVVIQLGAILAVVISYWSKMWPFGFNKGILIKKDIFQLWFKVLVAIVPAGIVGILWNDTFKRLFYNYQTVAIMLILFGVFFILIENSNAKSQKEVKIKALSEMTYGVAFVIGIFQVIAAVFPGTSRSGATIVGALLLGVSRQVAAEFTFFLGVPVMLGASLLELRKFNLNFSTPEFVYLIVAMVVAFVVSILSIRFLLNYIKTKDFKVFAWYRIILGAVILLYFGFLA